jgi:hypothetical protein
MDDYFASQPFPSVATPFQQDRSVCERSWVAVEAHKPYPSLDAAQMPSSYGRSCKMSRTKKIKCDKKAPCSNCLKSNRSCLYLPSKEARGRPSRRSTLEQSIQRLTEKVEDLERSQREVAVGVGVAITLCGKRMNTADSGQKSQQSAASPDTRRCGFNLPGKVSGHLIIHKTRSRYASDRFWVCLAEEVE